jgi:hypothetical protein
MLFIPPVLQANQLNGKSSPYLLSALDAALALNGLDSFDDSRGSSVAPQDRASLSGSAHGFDEGRARSLFEQYDANGDGVLDVGEFTEYLTSVFEALSTTPEFKASGVTPSQMAEATAAQCFAEADANGDGSLTFDEFKQWFEASAPSREGSLSREGSFRAPPPRALSSAVVLPQPAAKAAPKSPMASPAKAAPPPMDFAPLAAASKAAATSPRAEKLAPPAVPVGAAAPDFATLLQQAERSKAEAVAEVASLFFPRPPLR